MENAKHVRRRGEKVSEGVDGCDKSAKGLG